jgi:hypothetical protein
MSLLVDADVRQKLAIRSTNQSMHFHHLDEFTSPEQMQIIFSFF